ncbi:uncharacterized protein MYCFIDRAFT_127441 [Pseudocercospora fijiensis CIRAD86]|uniref:mRNA cap guanine-N(7) methyltransferase n=1 Tax=Pseudocercospora fijiensis (strain CIRAD86) TaxID=383855 RepID=N1Q8B8_PSEFD|nr:uncharacterized protein MYCFIDRAFT_127441 [Pseudocercospora fijiensis CIRAD86]EME87147.1 hypothetical protein MYCFIDRAFT_127441 [Pseudocercospora fijiensis CIRAD86]
MGSDETPVDSTTRRTAPKRKRETAASRASKASRNATPNAYSRRSPPREELARSRDPETEDEAGASPPRKLKRPGAGARINLAAREAAERERRQREEEERRNIQGRSRNAAEVIAEHYNAVPERGREWRGTDSKIKGMRSLNNWIKSTLIQKFSRPEIPVRDMKVLDMACGKGGDLGKWEKAPQVPILYVGCDIAAISIQQAKERYSSNNSRNRYRGPRMDAQFFVHDTFAHSFIDIPLIRNIGFNPNVGPGGIIQGGMATGGFDVVSMMFALHYSFETEELARGMLKNVAGALKKGGRFIGVMPNSDVITAQVKRLLAAESTGKTPNGTSTPAQPNGAVSAKVEDDDEWDPEKPAEGSEDGEWDPEKPSDPQSAVTNGADDDDDDWDPEKPSEPAPASAPVEQQPATNGEAHSPVDPDLPPLQWGNDIYNVKFPRQQPLTKKPLPRDGIFRPPFGWRYHYHLEEAVDAPEYVVPWEAFRALAEDYGLELMYRKGFREVFEDESEDHELGMLAERMKVLDRDRSKPNGGLLVSPEEMDAAAFYHAFCFYKT